MRLIFVNRFFFPDESATSMMLSDLVWALGGHFPDRHVITGRGHYTDRGKKVAAREAINGVEVHRVPTLGISNVSLVGRAANFACFHIFGSLAALRYARSGDIIVCLTDPPLISVPMRWIAWMKGASLVNWIQDIFPETADELGYGGNGWLGRLMRRLRDRSWKRARTNVVIGKVMEAYLHRRGVSPSQTTVIPNWSKEAELTPIAPETNNLRQEWGFEPDQCVVGYSGNLGRAHDVATMARAIALLDKEQRTDRRLRFLFVGGGAGHAELRSLVAHCAPGRVNFRPYQPAQRLRESLAVPDVHWISLYPGLEGLIVPSKFYGAVAVGRPIIFIGDPEGEIATLVREHECGRAFAIGESEALAAYLRMLRDDPEARQELGRNARRLAETELRRADRHAEWGAMLAAEPDPNA